MRLHRDMSVQVVKSAVGLFAAVPATLVHALDLFISSAGSLVLLGAWNGDERVHLCHELAQSAHVNRLGLGFSQQARDAPCADKAGARNALARQRGYHHDWARPSQFPRRIVSRVAYLVRPLLRRCRRGLLSVHWVAWRQGGSSMLPIPRPVRARLGVHAAAGMRVAVRHVRVGRIWRMLPVGVCWTRRRDGRIYRYIAVRIDRMGLMVSPILLGH